MKSNQIELDKAKFWTDHGILFCEIRNPDDNCKRESETLESYIKAITILCKGTAMPFLIDLRDSHGTFLMSSAKPLADSPELNRLCRSQGFVVNSLKMKLLISTYKRIYEPNTPYKIFNNIEDAIDYCISFNP